MKKDWTYKKLGEVATAKITDLLWFQEGPGVRKNQYTEDGVKLLNVANLVNGTVDLSTSSRYISEEEAYGKYKHFLVNEGDLIIASSGIQVSYFDKKMGFVTADQLPLCMNTSTIRFKVLDNSITDIKYFMYYLKSYPFKRQLAKYITGSAQLNFGPSHLKQMSMPLYPLAIQRSIVAELDLLHSVIEKKKEQLRELDNLAQSLFYQMFGDPITNPMGWDVKKLGEVGDIIGGSTPKTSDEKNWIGTNQWVSPAELKGDKYFGKTVHTISDEAASKLQLLPKGSVLLSSRAPIGKLAITTQPMYCNQGFKNIVCGPSINNEFVYGYLQLNIPRLQSLGVGATFKEISKKMVESFPIILPPLSLQQSFAAKVEAIEAQKQAITQSIHHTEALLAQRMDQYFG